MTCSFSSLSKRPVQVRFLHSVAVGEFLPDRRRVGHLLFQWARRIGVSAACGVVAAQSICSASTPHEQIGFAVSIGT